MKRARVLSLVVLCAAALAAACGSSNSLASRLEPSGGVTLTGVSISVNPPTVGGGVQATATAAFSNGSTSPIASGFGTDTPSVATATSSGSIAGLAIGDVTIFVEYQGMRAAKRVRVLPGYGGTFVGTYTVGACTGTGGFVNGDPTLNFCTEFFAGRVLPIAMQNTQSADLTTSTGLFLLGTVQGAGTGAIAGDGAFSFTGAFATGGTRMEIRNFTATSPSPGRVVGSFEMLWTDSGTEGSAIITATNVEMTRQAAVSEPASAGATLAGGLSQIAHRLVGAQ